MAAEQPKKAAGGAFGQYMKANRPELLKATAGKPATASMKLGSERFKALNASEKDKYQKMFEEAKKQYEKDFAAFIAAGGEVKARKSKKGKKEKKVVDPNKPKKPAGGAFGCWLAKNRAAFMKECAGQPITAVTKLAGGKWKVLDAAAKVPFEAEYHAKKAEYEKAMKAYVPPAGAAADEEAEADEEDEEEDDEEEEEVEGSAEEEKAAPKKRKADAKDAAPAAKKAKTTEVPADVAAEAKKLNFTAKLKSLIENPKVTASPKEVLANLKEHKGSVVATKKAMLGA